MGRLKASETSSWSKGRTTPTPATPSPYRALFRIKFAALNALNESLPIGGAEVKHVAGILRISHCDEAILGSHFHASARRGRAIRRFDKISVGKLWSGWVTHTSFRRSTHLICQ
jgi:hypothetical protein